MGENTEFATILDTPEEIDFARFLTMKSALKLEIAGMARHGRSAYAMAKEEYGLRGSRQSVWDQMEAIKKEAFGE